MKALFFLSFLSFTSLFSWVTLTPNNNIIGLDKSKYTWMIRNKDVKVHIYMGDKSRKFFSEESLKRYLTLKTRSFIPKLNLAQSLEDKDHANMFLELELYEYNSTLGVYYGLISLRYTASSYVKYPANNYMLTMAVAGNEHQILNKVKGNIDQLIEKFSEDYYFIEDIKKGKR